MKNVFTIEQKEAIDMYEEEYGLDFEKGINYEFVPYLFKDEDQVFYLNNFYKLSLFRIFCSIIKEVVVIFAYRFTPPLLPFILKI